MRATIETRETLAEVESAARRLERSVLAGQCDPEAAQQEIVRRAVVALYGSGSVELCDLPDR